MANLLVNKPVVTKAAADAIKCALCCDTSEHLFGCVDMDRLASQVPDKLSPFIRLALQLVSDTTDEAVEEAKKVVADAIHTATEEPTQHPKWGVCMDLLASQVSDKLYPVFVAAQSQSPECGRGMDLEGIVGPKGGWGPVGPRGPAAHSWNY